jgi:hypothetical protein
LPGDPAHQLLDEFAVAEAGGRLRLGVRSGRGDRGRGRRRELILAPPAVVGARTFPRAADLEPAAVDLRHRQRGPRPIVTLEFPAAELLHLVIAPRPKPMAHFRGDARQLPTADLHLGEFLKRRGGPFEFEGWLSGAGACGLLLDRRALVVGVQA